MKRVLCDAVVDPLKPDEGGQFANFLVTVSGRGEHDGVSRVYIMREQVEDEAAKEAIRQFVEEMGGDA